MLRYWSSKDSEASFELKFAKACKICMSESFDTCLHTIFDRYCWKFLSREETGNYIISSSNFNILLTFPDRSVAHKATRIQLDSKSCFTCSESNLCWNLVNTTEILWLALYLNGRFYYSVLHKKCKISSFITSERKVKGKHLFALFTVTKD